MSVEPTCKIRILAADDEEGYLDVYEALCEIWGFELIRVARAEEALEVATNFRLDLILLDLGMPGLGGIDALGMLRAHPSCKDIPILVVSGYLPTFELQAEVLSHGAAGCLAKPFTETELYDAVQEAIAGG